MIGYYNSCYTIKLLAECKSESYRVGLGTFQVAAVLSLGRSQGAILRKYVMARLRASGERHQLRMASNLGLLRLLTSNVTTIRPSKSSITSSRLHTPIWQLFSALALPLACFHESNVRGVTEQECVKAPGLRPKQNQQDTPFECQKKV